MLANSSTIAYSQDLNEPTVHYHKFISVALCIVFSLGRTWF